MIEQEQTGQSPVDQHVLYLINSSIDGEISASEQDELDQLLVRSPDVRSLNDELRAVTRILGEVRELDPPKYLQESIERQVRLPVRDQNGPEKPGIWGTGWVGANWLRTGLAMAVGVVLTLGVYEMGSEPISVEDSKHMVGTMANSESADQSGTMLDSIQLDSTKLRGLVELRNKDDFFVLDLQLSSDETTEVIIELAGRGFEFDGVSGSPSENSTSLVEKESVHFASMGEAHFAVRLRRTSAQEQVETLGLNVFANGELIQRAELIISKQ